MRKAADIERYTCYGMHMTAGILKNLALPNAVVGCIAVTWRRKLAEEFILINLVTKPGIRVSLRQEVLTLWEVELKKEHSACILHLHFSKRTRSLQYLEITGLKKKSYRSFKLAVENMIKKTMSNFDMIKLLYSEMND